MDGLGHSLILFGGFGEEASLLPRPRLITCWLLTKDSVCGVSCVMMLFRKANAVSAENFELVGENAAGRCRNVTVIMSDVGEV